MTITKVLYHQKLEPQGAMPADYHGLLIGSFEESYFLHKITAKPDFDQISKVSFKFNDTQIFEEIDQKGFVLIPLINHANTLAIEPGEEHQSFPPFPRRGFTPLIIDEVLYTEFGDLSF